MSILSCRALKAFSAIGLGLAGLISTAIASSNLKHNIEDCFLGISYQDDCEEKPVLLFSAIGGLALIADLVVLFTPNEDLVFARRVTRDHYRGLLRNPPTVHPEPVPPPHGPGAEADVDSTGSGLPDSLGSAP